MSRTSVVIATLVALLVVSLPASASGRATNCPAPHAARGWCTPAIPPQKGPATDKQPKPAPDTGDPGTEPIADPGTEPIADPSTPVDPPPTSIEPADAGVVYVIPSAIADDCSVDVTASINAWLRSVPNGTAEVSSVARFGRDACYRVDHTVGTHYTWDNSETAGYDRRHLVLDGNGATIDGSRNSATPFANRAGVSLVNSSDVTVENFKIKGAHPNPCNLAAEGGPCRDGGYSAAYEWQHGVGVFGGKRVTVRNNRIHNAWGDGVTMAQGWGVDTTSDSLVEGNVIDGAGRMGVALTTNDNITVRGNTFDRISYHVIDLEPEVSAVTNITIENNLVKRHYLTFVAAGSGICTPRLNYVIRDNVLSVPGVTAWPALMFESTRYHSHGGCDAEAVGLVIHGNTIPATLNNLEAVRVRGFRDVSINDNSSVFQGSRTMVTLADVSGSVQVKRNYAPGVPSAYWIDGVAHGPGVASCGNITSQPMVEPC